jgi:hypothetical protein
VGRELVAELFVRHSNDVVRKSIPRDGCQNGITQILIPVAETLHVRAVGSPITAASIGEDAVPRNRIVRERMQEESVVR